MTTHHRAGVQRFDQAAFAAAVQAVIAARDVTDRAVARAAQLSSSTVTRTIRQGNAPDVEGLMRLADWAGLSLDAFIMRQWPIGETPLVSEQRRLVAAQQAAEAAARTLGLLIGREEQ